MKRTDIILIVIVAGISMVIAFFVTQTIFGDSATETVKVKTIDKIDSEIADPNKSIFNAEAINPAVEVQVGSGEQSQE